MRTRSSLRSSLVVIGFAAACGFDPGSSRGSGIGLGDEGDSSTAEAGDAGNDAAAGTTGLHGHGTTGGEPPGETGVLDGVEPGSDGSVASTGAIAGDTTGAAVLEGTGAIGSSGAIDGCPHEKLDLLWAADAVVTAPMQLVTADANGSPLAAVSSVAESGTITFTVAFDCPGTYQAWGLVWDLAPGGYASNDPDSFYVGTGDDEVTWRYGCQTGEADSGLSWQPLQSLLAQPCDVAALPIVVDAPGEVAITFRNREAGGGSSVAGIAALLVADDASSPDPYNSYTP